ncbi:hypothetical protein HMN09_00388100 [Mycena chlorophos]|uniref:Uncharacterized protein n=1 Tax=Mycena chlorophos TaxID=658473 RepID=A0A8H6TJA5_MYCCL|nr:hypothetical protein HMN09_00388100 [Mycena chlorophos]
MTQTFELRGLRHRSTHHRDHASDDRPFVKLIDPESDSEVESESSKPRRSLGPGLITRLMRRARKYKRRLSLSKRLNVDISRRAKSVSWVHIPRTPGAQLRRPVAVPRPIETEADASVYATALLFIP